MAMKEYELAPVAAADEVEDYFGDMGAGENGIGSSNGGGGVDVGQRNLLEGKGPRSDEEQGQAGANGEGGRPRSGWCGCLSTRFYQQFFDVDTQDVADRWMQSLVSCKREKGFLELIGEKPDAYGPFWNATTLVFLIALSNNISTGGYDLNKLVTSAWLVYGYSSVCPVVLWLLLNQLDIALSLIQLVCICGYSMGPFLPAVLLCALPLPYVATAALTTAGIVSVTFLLRALTPSLLEKNMGWAAPIMAGMGCCQALFAIVLKLVFFA